MTKEEGVGTLYCLSALPLLLHARSSTDRTYRARHLCDGPDLAWVPAHEVPSADEI